MNADQIHEAQAPCRGQENAQQGQHDAVEAAEVSRQQQHNQGRGVQQNLEDLRQVGVNPAGQHRVSDRVDAQAVACFRLADFLQPGEGLDQFVGSRTVHLCPDDRHLAIGRHQASADARVRLHLRLQGLELRRRQDLGIRVIVGLGADRAGFVDINPARRAMGDAGHEVVIDAGQHVDALGDAFDRGECFAVEDRALLDLHRNRDDVGATEDPAHLVMQLDIGMLLRQEILEIRSHLQAGDLAGEERRQTKNQREHKARAGKNPLFAPLQRGDYLLADHWTPCGSMLTIAGVLAPEPPTTMRDERPGTAIPPRR